MYSLHGPPFVLVSDGASKMIVNVLSWLICGFAAFGGKSGSVVIRCDLADVDQPAVF